MAADSAKPEDRPAPLDAPIPHATELPEAPLQGALTADDIRTITSDGLTLGDAIRTIEAATE